MYVCVCTRVYKDICMYIDMFLCVYVYKYIYEVSGSPMAIILGLKYALSRKGIGSENMAMPVYEEMTDRQKEIIDRFLKDTEQYDI